MASKKTKQTIYIGSLYRFNYELTTVGFTEEDVKKTLLKEYVKHFKIWNDGLEPSEEIDRWGKTYLESAEEDMEVLDLEVGKVEWR